VSCGEENLLGYPGDRYTAEDILLHAFGRGEATRSGIFVGDVGRDTDDTGTVVGCYIAHEHPERSGLQAGATPPGVPLGRKPSTAAAHRHPPEKRRDRTEDQMPGLERTQMRVEGTERETHHELACGLRGYLAKYCTQSEARLGPLQSSWTNSVSQPEACTNSVNGRKRRSAPGIGGTTVSNGI